jgi:hypothetical protein
MNVSSEHLGKARAALKNAKVDNPQSRDCFTQAKWLEVARVEANIAQAAALERIATALEYPLRMG